MELKPGYKQSEVGVIPEDWEVKAVADVVKYTNGKAHEQNITDSGNFVVVNSKFISSEGFIRKYSQKPFCPTEKEDVLMVMSDVPNGRAIAKCFWVDSDNTYTVNQRICVLHPNKINGKLLYYKLDRNPFYLAFDDGAKQTNLRKEDVISCPLSIPSSEFEQGAIATALSDVDALLDGLDRLIAKKRDIKQAAMQLLLTGETRLQGFEGEWAVKRLGDHVTFLRNGVNSRAELTLDDPVKYLHYGDIHACTSVMLDPTSLPGLPSGKAKNLDRLRDGDLIFVDASEDLAGVSKSVEICGASGTEIVSGLHTIAARFEKEVFADGFKAYLQFCPVFSNQLRRLAAGTKVYATNRFHIASVEMRLPGIKEQEAIAATLSDIDAEIAALERRRNKTKDIKQAMMQELLTGKTRLVTPGGPNA
jgi:type I restriction enzyme, S subunit